MLQRVLNTKDIKQERTELARQLIQAAYLKPISSALDTSDYLREKISHWNESRNYLE